MSDSTSLLVQVETSQAQKEVTVNNLFDAHSPASFGGRRAEACSLLTWGYYGGRWGGTLVANGTLALDPSDVSYIVADRSTGAISADTATTNWDNAALFARLYAVTTGAASVQSFEDHRTGPGGVATADAGFKILQFACGDETTDLAVASNVVQLRAPQAMTLVGVRASVNTAPTGAPVTVDINVNGSSILSTKITIEAGELTSLDATTQPVISSASIADDALIAVDVDGVGSTVAGAGLKITMRGA